MKKQDIANAIVSRVERSKTVNYSNWRIGLTHDPNERKKQHEDDGLYTQHWKMWIADSLSDAQDIESYFINKKKMEGGTGGDLDAHKTVYVYIL